MSIDEFNRIPIFDKQVFEATIYGESKPNIVMVGKNDMGIEPGVYVRSNIDGTVRYHTFDEWENP